jgi:methylenetetrahydrofolate reductase (NADPH)
MMRNMVRSLSRRSPRLLFGSPAPAVRRVVGATHYELVPLKNLDAQLAYLPAGSHVTVTCSPTKGIGATLDLTARLQGLGLHVTPHIAARLVVDRAELRALASRFRELGLEEIFLMAGDEEAPSGCYHGTLDLLRDLLAEDHGLTRIGVAGYPDGHLFLDRQVLRQALHDKQATLHDAGVEGWVSTQMCFDPQVIAAWLQAARQDGLTLPVRLGIPGPIDRAKLLTMGMRVGVGQSLRYLQKNRSGLQRLLTSTGYDPSRLLGELGNDLDTFGVVGLHLFTFNQLQATTAWVSSLAAPAGGGGGGGTAS